MGEIMVGESTLYLATRKDLEEILKRHNKPLSISDIHHILYELGYRVSRSFIYSTLLRLHEKGIVERIRVDEAHFHSYLWKYIGDKNV